MSLARIPDGSILQGHAHGEPVVLARRGEKVFAIGAFCSHYGAPLADGLLVGDTIRCPWHHACFDLRSGDALRAPALDAISCWRVEERDGIVYVGERLPFVNPSPLPATSRVPKSIVIVGGGAAGNAAAETLRSEGYSGRITMLSADAFIPCDRPNLSKGYLSGAAPSESNLLRSLEFYREQRIDVGLNARVSKIDTAAREVILADGTRHAYDALLLATGAEPVRLDIPGSDLPHVHYLRTLSDGEALVAKATVSQQAVVIGASFIGLEVTASLRARNVAVHVVAPDAVPMERILGPDIGKFIRRLHERNGVTFHLGTTVASIDERGVTLKTENVSQRNWSSLASASDHRSRWRKRRVSPSIAVSVWTNTSRPAYRGFSRPVTSSDGRIASRASASGSSIGWSPNVKDRLPLATWLGVESGSRPCHSFGPSNMTSASRTSVTPNGGMRLCSKDSSTTMFTIVRSRSGATAENWPWH